VRPWSALAKFFGSGGVSLVHHGTILPLQKHYTLKSKINNHNMFIHIICSNSIPFSVELESREYLLKERKRQMGLQHFDGTDVDPEDVLVALCFRFTIPIGSENWMYKVLERAYDNYHDAQSTKRDEKAQYIHKAVEVYKQENELPMFAMKIGTEWILEAYKQEFATWFREKHFGSGKMENEKPEEAQGRVLRGEVQENRGGNGLSRHALSGAK